MNKTLILKLDLWWLFTAYVSYYKHLWLILYITKKYDNVVNVSTLSAFITKLSYVCLKTSQWC